MNLLLNIDVKTHRGGSN